MAEKFVLGSAQSVIGIIGLYVGGKITSVWIANEELKKLERSLNLICPFIRDAENKLSSSTSSTEQGNEGIKNWLMELKNVIYDIEDVLDEAATDALRLEVMKEGGRKKLSNKVRYHLSSSKHKFLSPFSLSIKVNDLRGILDQIAADVKGLGIIASHIDTLASHGSEDRIRIPLPFINKADNILGRDEVKREIMGKVVGNGVEYYRGLSALAIVGIGGMGKTTLAQMIYADLDIDSNFDIKLWGCVSKPFNFKMVLKRILGSINISIGSDDKGQMVNALTSVVRDKKYFLVLDDVWPVEDTEEWKQLRDVFAYGGKKESVMLVTTRDEKVATRAIGTRQIFKLDELSFDVCMSIFTKNVFDEGEGERYPNLVEVGKIIVGNCKGLPLAVQAVGSMLRGERDEREWRRIAENDLWKHEGVLAALRLSYNDLPSHLKLCFAYLSLYPKGVKIFSTDFVSMLVAQGLITNKDNVDGEDTGERYMKELLSRSLLQEPRFLLDGKLRKFKMHDLVHDLALDVMGEELVTVTDSNDHPKVSRFVRHISWCREHLPSKKEIPRELLLQAHQVRTFYFPYEMTSVDKIYIQQVLSSFKCLRSLDLGGTDIEELPDSIGDLKHLRYLDLYNNVRLKSIPNSICKLLNLQTLDLGGCEQLEKLPEDIGKLINLTHLFLTLSSQSKYLIPKRMKVIRSSLRHLVIYKCSGLISLLEEEEKDDVSKNIIFLTELRTLQIADCPKFSPHLSNSLRYLTSLNELAIQVSEQVDGQMESPPQPTAAGVGVGGMKPDGLRSLKYLLIDRLQTVEGLPDVLQTAVSSLRRLHLWNCAHLKSLPEWLRNFKSLSHLFIINCPQLSTLPSDGFLGLTSLQKLRIRGCPYLSLRCSENGWDYWPRNSHILLDGKQINFKGEST